MNPLSCFRPSSSTLILLMRSALQPNTTCNVIKVSKVLALIRHSMSGDTDMEDSIK
jgi:hypothetical protein